MQVRNGLYCVLSSQNKSLNKPSLHMAFTCVRTTLHGRHESLAHLHDSLHKRLLHSFKLPVSFNNHPAVWDSCQLGKIYRLPFTESHVPSTKPFDLVYSDVWGSSPVFSINGNHYFLLFVDDRTKSAWIYFLSQKSQVLSSFIQFHKMIQTQFHTTVKSLQSDWEENIKMYLLI